jgi:SAM-dependent methyltransferase
MKREFLKELGLADDLIEKVMAENGKDVEAQKTLTTAEATKLIAANDTIKQLQDTVKKFDGVDVASELLARNPRLDHRIVADLASADLDPASFDTVVCWDVLEHLGNAGSALDRLERALGETGTLILKVPNLRSPKGIVTKYTPYAFHKWVYRRFSVSDATPFRTHFDGAIAPHELLRWATARRLRLRWAAYWESDLQQRLRRRVHLDGGAWNLVAGSVRRLSAGRLDASATDFVLAFERPAP